MSHVIRWVLASEVADANVFVLALYEAPDCQGWRLELQGALAVDAQDLELGHDRVCTVTEDGATFYGGVLGYALDARQLQLRYTQEAASVLGLDERLKLSFVLSGERLEVLRSALERLLPPDAAC